MKKFLCLGGLMMLTSCQPVTPSHTLTVVVQDAQDQVKLSGAEVEVSGWQFDTFGVSGEDGKIAFALPNLEVLTVRVTKSQYRQAERTLPELSQDATIVVGLER